MLFRHHNSFVSQHLRPDVFFSRTGYAIGCVLPLKKVLEFLRGNRNPTYDEKITVTLNRRTLG